MGLSSNYPLIDICFNNKSTVNIVGTNNIEIEFGVNSDKYSDNTKILNYGDIEKGTSSDNSNIVWNKQLIDIDFSANSTAMNVTSPKIFNLGINSKYLWSNKELDYRQFLFYGIQKQ